MRLFFHKHPLLTFVLFACLFTAAKSTFSTPFQSDERQSAQAEIRQAIGAIASRQVVLEERDVRAAIRLFRTKSRRQAPSVRQPGNSISTLGLITTAQAAQTSAQQDPDMFRQAGFSSYERVPGVLASVSLGAFLLALEDTQRNLKAGLEKGQRIVEDPLTNKELRAQITQHMARVSERMKMTELMASSAKPLPGNLELVKRHRTAIIEAMSASRGRPLSN